MAFYGFLQVREYVNLTGVMSCTEDDLCMILHESKTDPFGHGYTIQIFQNLPAYIML